MARAAVIALALAVAAPAPAIAQSADTVDLLTEALEALRTGDAAAFEAAADELRDDGHWLPDAGWMALEAQDDEQLSFVWLLLEAPGEEPVLFAFDQLLFERDLVLNSSPTSAADRAMLDLVDGDGEVILQVLEHRRIGVSVEAHELLGRLPDDPADWPTIEQYDQVVAMMANRIDMMGFPLPPAPELDAIMDAFPYDELPPPPQPPHEVSSDGAMPSSPSDAPAEAPEPATEVEAPTGDDTTDSDGATGGDVSDEPVDDTAERPPASTPLNVPAPTDASPSDLGPLTIGVGIVGALGLAVGAVAMRRHRHHHELVGIAYTDSLTGLGNRRRLDLDLSREGANGSRPTSMLMIDVDHFKQFNDQYGHVIGDEALRHVARVIAENVRGRDLTYRYGGEEFSVLLPNTAPDDANEVGERIRRAIERERIDLPDGSTVAVTASLGLSSGPAVEVSGLVQRADEALYVAKDCGRNQLARG